MAKAEVQLGLNADLFNRGIRAAGSAVSTFARTAARGGALAAGALASVGVAVSGAAMVQGIRNVYELADSLGDVKAQSGIAVSDLFKLKINAEDAGVSFEEMVSSISRMQNQIGKGSKVFEQFGIKASQLKTLRPHEQFLLIGKSIAAIEDPAERATAAIEVFGKTGAKLLALFSDEGFGGSSAQITALANFLERNAETFGRVSDKLGKAGLSFVAFAGGIAEKAAPALEKMLDKLAAADMAKHGRDFADAIATAAGWMMKVKDGAASATATFGVFAAMAKKLVPGMDYLTAKNTPIPKPDLGPGVPVSRGGTGPEAVSKGVAPDFWKKPAAGLRSAEELSEARRMAFKGGRIPKELWDQAEKEKGKGPFMNRIESNDAKFNAEQKRQGTEFPNDKVPGSPEALQKWTERMGIKRGAYNKIRSRTREERAAEKEQKAADKKEKVEATVADASIDKIVNKIGDLIPK